MSVLRQNLVEKAKLKKFILYIFITDISIKQVHVTSYEVLCDIQKFRKFKILQTDIFSFLISGILQTVDIVLGN